MTAPVELIRDRVRPEWIDFNGHMTSSAYVVAFDDAVFAFLRLIGIDPEYRDQKKCSTFALELHTTFQREMPTDAPYLIEGRILAADAKRVHFWYELKHGAEGWLSATLEVVSMHMDMTVRRAATFPPDIAGRIETHLAAGARLPYPELAGRAVGLGRRRQLPQ